MITDSENYTENYVTCPYEPAHRLLHHRFITHLVKCRRNHPDCRKVSCMLNAEHVVPEPELAYHMENCPDRKQIDNFITAPVSQGPVYEIKQNVPHHAATEELWSDEDVPSYDPLEYCDRNMILRRVDTQSKAERKGHRARERERFQQLEANGGAGSSEPSGFVKQKPPAARYANPQASKVVPERRELPPEVVKRMEELKLHNSSNPGSKPLSEILNSAKAGFAGGVASNACDRDEDVWTTIPVRGRGRGIRKMN